MKIAIGKAKPNDYRHLHYPTAPIVLASKADSGNLRDYRLWPDHPRAHPSATPVEHNPQALRVGRATLRACVCFVGAGVWGGSFSRGKLVEAYSPPLCRTTAFAA